MNWLKRLFRKLHIHNWVVLEYERKQGAIESGRKNSQFFRKVKFRICSCGLRQERICGSWGPIVNMETLKEAMEFEEDFRRTFRGLKEDFSDL